MNGIELWGGAKFPKSIVKLRVVMKMNKNNKEQMKMVAHIAREVKNDDMRRGGYSPSQWVLSRFPRRPCSPVEEDEWGQLGSLQNQADPATAFGMAANFKFTASKQFVKVDC